MLEPSCVSVYSVNGTKLNDDKEAYDRIYRQMLEKRLPSWLHQARCLHDLGRTHEAYHLLVDVVELFPAECRRILEDARKIQRLSQDYKRDHFNGVPSKIHALLPPF